MTARRGGTGRHGSLGADLGHPPGAADTTGAGAGDDAGRGEDEPQLRAMRAVWLAMREEAPPDRGLSELLAAARRKADDMAEAMQPTPTRWQRLLAALRRPPVLALATALVLIGGGVLIGRRVGAPKSGLLDAAGETGGAVPDDPADRARVPAGRSPDTVGAMPGPAAGSAAPPSATPGELGSPGSRAPVEPAEVRPSAGQETTSAPVVHTAQPTRAAVEPLAAPRKEPSSQRPAAAPVAPAPAAPDALRTKGEVVEDRGADESAVRDRRKNAVERPTVLRGAPSPPPPTHHREETPAPAVADPEPVADVRAADHGAGNGASASGENAKAVPPRSQPPRATPGQLYEQCEAAARRGDCEAVRRLVEQISQTDRGYRARIANESAMAKCLAE